MKVVRLDVKLSTEKHHIINFNLLLAVAYQERLA